MIDGGDNHMAPEQPAEASRPLKTGIPTISDREKGEAEARLLIKRSKIT